MKAVVFESFGDRSVLNFHDVPTPRPEANEVLVKVAYAAVNPVDWKIREGFLQSLLPHELPIVPGWDAAGTVESVGANVTKFKTGDRVYAYCRKPVVKWGAYAEYISLDEAFVALAPKRFSLAEAAAVPLVALTAWQALFGIAKLKSGDRVLIHAGAGGVGGMAIQFAKWCGATVYTTASKRNHSYVKELGADVIVDYTTEDFVEVCRKENPQGFEVIFDCAGGDTLERSYDLLAAGGYLVTIVDQPDDAKAEARGAKASFHFVEPNGAQLRSIADLIDAEIVQSLEITELPISDVKKAHELIESHHTKGKIVLRV